MKLLGMQTTLGLSAIAIVGLTTSQAANAAILYSITDLTVYEYRTNRANDINDVGQVAGFWADESGSIAYVWDSTNGRQNIDSFYSRSAGVPYGINNLGQVVGSTSVYGIWETAWVWDSTNGRRNFLTDGVQREGAIGQKSRATDINDSGQIVGWYDINYAGMTEDQIYPRGPHHAFIWDSVNGMQDLGTLSGGASEAYGMNNAGQVVGASDGRAFLWDSTNGMQNLGTLDDGGRSSAQAINELGQVVGTSNGSAFLWDSTNGMQDLGKLDGNNTFASNLNDRGQVVGYSGDNWTDYRALLWDSTNGMQDLNDLIDPNSGWILREAKAINNQGQIVGYGVVNPNSVSPLRAFLLTPISQTPEPESVPEPSAGLGLLAFGFLGARKLLKREKSGNCVGMSS